MNIQDSRVTFTIEMVKTYYRGKKFKMHGKSRNRCENDYTHPEEEVRK